MNYLIISDTHGMAEEVLSLIKKYKDYQVIHCGDYETDLKTLLDNKVSYVRGNCDTFGPIELSINSSYGTIYVTHGHLYNVKFKYDNIYFKAREKDAKYVLFGHTHVPFIENIEGLWLINPGSLKFSRTYAVIEDGIPTIKSL